MVPAKDVECRDVQNEMSAGFEDTPQLANCVLLDGVREALKHVERRRDIHADIRKRYRREAGASDLAAAHLMTEHQPVQRQIESVGIAVPCEPRNISPCATSAVQQRWRWSARDGAGNFRLHKPSEAAKPEMRLLGEMRELQKAIHAVSEARRSCYHADIRPQGPGASDKGQRPETSGQRVLSEGRRECA